MESEHGSRSSKHSSKDADTSRNKDDTLAPLISLVDSDHDSQSDTDIEITINGKTSGSAKKSKSSNSVSSSSSESLAADDFFLMDAEMLKKSSTSPAAAPKAHGDAQTPVTDDKNDKLSDISCKSKEPDNESPFVPSLQLSDVTHESSMQSMSPVKSPSIQVMERPGEFDPDRIPASVFASTPSTAVDWSVASNDSLFSIQIGNNSFSGEQFLMMGGDVHKTEELYSSGELYTSGELSKSGELIRSRRPPLSPVGKPRSIKTPNVGKKPEETEVADETMKDSPKENGVDQVEEKVPQLEGTGNSSSVNRHSNGSGTSCQSFAFPILTDNGRSDSGIGYTKQQDTQATDYEKVSPKAKKASDNRWYCCSLPSWSCSSRRWSCSSCRRRRYCCC